MTGKELWKAFIEANGLTDCEHEEWAFGVDANLLAHLVISGEKTATASVYPLYEIEGEPLPMEGEYSIILDANDNAVCVIQTIKVSVVPFNEVTEEHAFKEGEGDKSISYWKHVHETCFTQWLQDAGLQFSEDIKVVCEEFIMVYPR